MTFNTSDVAVCCSNDSLRSRVRACTSSNRRAFSIAMTAWSAKVVTSSICLSVNGCTVLRCKVNTPIGIPSRKRGNTQCCAETSNFCGFDEFILGISKHVGNLNGLTLEQGAASDRTSSDRNCADFLVFSILPLVPIAGGKLKDVAFRSEKVCHIRPAQPRRRLDERLQHRLQIERRTAHNLEHFGGGGLLL